MKKFLEKRKEKTINTMRRFAAFGPHGRPTY
jgi:hypothetical protein